jgi:hypothetical protein
LILLGRLSLQANEWDQAIDYLERAQAIAQKINFYRMVADATFDGTVIDDRPMQGTEVINEGFAEQSRYQAEVLTEGNSVYVSAGGRTKPSGALLRTLAVLLSGSWGQATDLRVFSRDLEFISCDELQSLLKVVYAFGAAQGART